MTETLSLPLYTLSGRPPPDVFRFAILSIIVRASVKFDLNLFFSAIAIIYNQSLIQTLLS